MWPKWERGMSDEEQLRLLAQYYGKPVTEDGRPVELTERNPGWGWVKELPWNKTANNQVVSISRENNQTPEQLERGGKRIGAGRPKRAGGV